MGGFLTCIAADTVCCVGTAACKCCFQIFGLAASTATRLAYSLLFLLNSILAWIMLSDWAINQLKERFDKIPFYKIDCPEGYCYGTLATYRVTFALALFHLIMALIMINVKSSKDYRSQIQNGFWGPKVVICILLLVAAFYIPNEFFIAYGHGAMVFAGFFILIQLVLLIDLAYRVSERCLNEYESSGEKGWILGLSGGTILLMLAFITITGFLYAHFGSGGCGLNQFFITFNLILAVIAWSASIHPAVQDVNPQVGLPQASFVSIYALYLCFSGMSSEPMEQCNPLIHNNDPRNANIIIGVIITFVALAYSASSTAMQGNNLLNAGEPSYNLVADNEAGSGYGNDREYDDEESGVIYSYSFFHFTFAVASMYVAMLLTNWDPLQKSGETVYVGQSWTAVWIKIVTSWITILLYLWTIIAPVLLPDREFF